MVRNFAVVDNQLYYGDTDGYIYLYGGLAGNQYDDGTVVTVRTPPI